MLIVATVVGVPSTDFDINGAVLRALRIKDGWSIAEFAREVELVPSHVSNIEAGRRGCSARTAKRMAELLGVPLSVLQREQAVTA